MTIRVYQWLIILTIEFIMHLLIFTIIPSEIRLNIQLFYYLQVRFGHEKYRTFFNQIISGESTSLAASKYMKSPFIPSGLIYSGISHQFRHSNLAHGKLTSTAYILCIIGADRQQCATYRKSNIY